MRCRCICAEELILGVGHMMTRALMLWYFLFYTLCKRGGVVGITGSSHIIAFVLFFGFFFVFTTYIRIPMIRELE